MPKIKYYIESLPIIFRRIDAGEIHIPQFQRQFVWGREQILQLFDSIYNGLFIGSLLFWQSLEKNFMFSQDDFITQYQGDENIHYMYVIDGTQRLRVLYNCLHKNDNSKTPQYSVGFELEKEKFIHLDKVYASETVIVLSSVFSHEEILKKQIFLASQDNGQALIKALNKLVSAFVDYQLPVIVIDEVTKDELITVFKRINTTGVTLSEEEILRARERNDE